MPITAFSDPAEMTRRQYRTFIGRVFPDTPPGGVQVLIDAFTVRDSAVCTVDSDTTYVIHVTARSVASRRPTLWGITTIATIW